MPADLMPTLTLSANHVVVAVAIAEAAQSEDGVGTRAITLLQLPDNPATPFVTYQVDNRGNCFWGHYHEEANEAWADYLDRLNGLHRHAMRGL